MIYSQGCTATTISVQNIFVTSEKSPVPISRHSSLLSLPRPGGQRSTVCICRFSCSGHFMSTESRILWPFVFGFFHSAQCFQGSSHRVTFYGRSLFHCDILFIHSSTDGHWSHFCSPAILNSAALNIHAQVFVCTRVLISLGCVPRGGIAGSYMVNSLRNLIRLFSKGAATVCIPTSSVQEFQFLLIFISTCYYYLFLKF